MRIVKFDHDLISEERAYQVGVSFWNRMELVRYYLEDTDKMDCKERTTRLFESREYSAIRCQVKTRL